MSPHNMILPPEDYEGVPTLKIAFTDGKLAMCQEIREMVHGIMAQYNLNPFRSTGEFEQGQIQALTFIIESCLSFEESCDKNSETNNFDS